MYLTGVSFPSLGLSFHICTMGAVAMTIFRRLTIHMFQKSAQESVIQILRSLLISSTGRGLVAALIQHTFVGHLLYTEGTKTDTVSVPSWNLHSRTFSDCVTKERAMCFESPERASFNPRCQEGLEETPEG